MNKARRKILEDLLPKLEGLKDIVSDLEDQEEEARDALPESLMDSEQYERMDNIYEELQQARSDLENAYDAILNAIQL